MAMRPEEPKSVHGMGPWGNGPGSSGGGDAPDAAGAKPGRADLDSSARRFRAAFASLTKEERKRLGTLIGLVEAPTANDSAVLTRELQRTRHGILTFAGLGFGFLACGLWINWLGWPGLFFGLSTLSFGMVLVGFLIAWGEWKALRHALTTERLSEWIKDGQKAL